MRQVRPRIGAELLLVGVALMLLVGALGLIVSAYRRSAPPRSVPPPVAFAETPAAPEPKTEPPLAAPSSPPPQPVTIDRTPERLRAIAARKDEQNRRSASLGEKAAALEKVVSSALAQAEKWRNRERLIRGEVAAREADAHRAEDEADALARERDILATQVPTARQKLDRARLRAKDGVAVLPYQGPNGTWRRPIAVECRGDAVTIQPRGRTYSLADLSSFLNPRRHPLVIEVAKAMLRARDLTTPEGLPVVPYLVFVVRPDGVRSYYAARSLLEPLGIAYGYELVDAEADIEFPDLDDASEWGGQAPGDLAAVWPPPASNGGGTNGLGNGSGGAGTGFAGGGTRFGTPPGGVGMGLERSGRGLAEGGGGEASLPSGGGRVFATPGDGRGAHPGGSGVGDRPRWGGSSGLRDGEDGAGIEALEEIRRGAGARTPDDGRVAIHPGLPPRTAPSFAEAPPSSVADGGAGLDPEGGRPSTPGAGRGSRADLVPGNLPGENLAGSGRPASTGGERAGTTASSSIGAGRKIAQDGRVPVTTGAGGAAGDPSGPRGVGSPRTLRQAVAARERLVAPTAPGLPSDDAAPPPAASVDAGSSTPGGSSSASGGSRATGTPPNGSPPATGLPMPPGMGGSGPPAMQDHSQIRGLVAETIEMTVSCGPKGVTIYPGGRSIDLAAMTADDAKVVDALKGIVGARYQAAPGMGLRPKVRFLVKPGGESVYRKARWQLSQSGTPWPTTLHMADRDPIRLLGGDSP